MWVVSLSSNTSIAIQVPNALLLNLMSDPSQNDNSKSPKSIFARLLVLCCLYLALLKYGELLLVFLNQWRGGIIIFLFWSGINAHHNIVLFAVLGGDLWSLTNGLQIGIHQIFVRLELVYVSGWAFLLWLDVILAIFREKWSLSFLCRIIANGLVKSTFLIICKFSNLLTRATFIWIVQTHFRILGTNIRRTGILLSAWHGHNKGTPTTNEGFREFLQWSLLKICIHS